MHSYQHFHYFHLLESTEYLEGGLDNSRKFIKREVGIIGGGSVIFQNLINW